MPLYEYTCRHGCKAELLRPYDKRDQPVRCIVHEERMTRRFPVPHLAPDGVYSYAPNIGSAQDFERRHAEATDRQQRVDGGMYDG